MHSNQQSTREIHVHVKPGQREAKVLERPKPNRIQRKQTGIKGKTEHGSQNKISKGDTLLFSLRFVFTLYF